MSAQFTTIMLTSLLTNLPQAASAAKADAAELLRILEKTKGVSAVECPQGTTAAAVARNLLARGLSKRASCEKAAAGARECSVPFPDSDDESVSWILEFKIVGDTPETVKDVRCKSILI